MNHVVPIMKYPVILAALISTFSYKILKTGEPKNGIVAKGQMPSITKDNHNNLHVVFGTGDSIMYTYSANNGNTFSKPTLIKKLAHVYSFAMRGPQIAVTNNYVVVTACTTGGNIFSFYKEKNSGWKEGTKVNDADEVSKEGLMALSASGDNVFAVWLDLRNDHRNKIYGAKSNDGGKTWSKNILVYASPDSTVCECCKPSVVMQGNKVQVMFRNWLNGNRDLYLIQSADGGNSFGVAQKLGTGSWKLNGCPMDGGGLAVANDGVLQTVWRRQNKIYADEPGKPEQEIGEGKNCTIETVNGKNVYAWTDVNGNVICLLPGGTQKNIGKGILPLIKSAGTNKLICIWQSDQLIKEKIINY